MRKRDNHSTKMDAAVNVAARDNGGIDDPSMAGVCVCVDREPSLVLGTSSPTALCHATQMETTQWTFTS